MNHVVGTTGNLAAIALLALFQTIALSSGLPFTSDLGNVFSQFCNHFFKWQGRSQIEFFFKGCPQSGEQGSFDFRLFSLSLFL
jgi:hypothetical protein